MSYHVVPLKHLPKFQFTELTKQVKSLEKENASRENGSQGAGISDQLQVSFVSLRALLMSMAYFGI